MELEASKSNYAIPYRAIGSKFRDVAYQDESGNLSPMTRIQPEERIDFQSAGSTNSAKVYYIRGNDIVLVPDIGSSPTGSLVFIYYLRPNDLVEEDRVGVITAINTSTGVITMSSFPEQFAVGVNVDFLQVKSGHKTKAFDIPITAISENNLTITVAAANIPSDLVVGDHVASAGECMVPQIPSDLHSVLAQRVAARCLEALGDTQGLTNANTKLQEMEQKTGNLIDNRSEGQPQKINNLKSPLQQLYRRRSW